MTDQVLKLTELLTAVVGLGTAIVGLFHAGQASVSPAFGELPAGLQAELVRRRQRATVRLTIVLVCFLVIFGVVLYSWNSDYLLFASLQAHDPLIFRGQSTYPVARVYPDRGTLLSDGKINEVIDGTKKTFDMQATNARDFLTNHSNTLVSALKRGVYIRLMLFDVRDRSKCDALAKSLGKNCRDFESSYNESLDKLYLIHQAAPQGNLEVRLYSDIPLKSVWIKDRDLPDDAIWQVEFHDMDDSGRSSMRMGRLGGRLTQLLTGQFNELWIVQQRTEVDFSNLQNCKISIQ
jgi:hypothetical protein